MLVKIIAFVVPLGFDTLAVAVMLGLRGVKPLRPAITFAFFEAVMPLVGLLLGRLIGAQFATAAGAIGGVVLLGVALYMLKEALEDEDETDSVSFSSLRAATLAGFGISTDELAVGFPMGTSALPPETIGAIAVQAFIVTYVGIVVGTGIGRTLGRRTARISGFVAAIAFGLLGAYLIAQRFVSGLPPL